VSIADGTRASPGDLIICTRNHHSVEAGEPGRALANGDLLRIDAVTRDGLLVRRALDADPATGQRRWTERPFAYARYQDAKPGYAVTDHAAQGRTAHTGLAVITGTEDRPHAYVALTRGTDANLAYAFTVSPKRADPVPGPRPAPELARYDTINAERAGQSAPPTQPAPPGTALGVLSDVLDNDGQQPLGHPDPQPGPRRRRPPRHPARDLDRRDHPGPQPALPRPAHERPAARPPGPVAMAHPARRRTAARLVVRAGPRHRRPGPPRPRRADRRADGCRKDRIGEHAAEHALPWAINALGPVPEDPVDRLNWQHRAASIGAWRELSGYDHPTDPIGPEPTAPAPDKRAAWDEALAALGPVDGPDVRGMPDGRLLHLRDTAPSAIWPWPPMPNCAAGIRSSGLPRSVRPNHRPPPTSGARAHPDHRAGHPGCGPVDQGPGRRAPEIRRPAGRPAEPDDPRRRPRLRRPRPGLPCLDRLLARRSCGRRNHRSVPRPASSSAPRTARPTSKPGNDRGPVHLDTKGRPRLLRG
jgi:hypothetical protein